MVFFFSQLNPVECKIKPQAKLKKEILYRISWNYLINTHTAEIHLEMASKECLLAPSKLPLFLYMLCWYRTVPDLQQVSLFNGTFNNWAFCWFYSPSPSTLGLACSSEGKESACKAGHPGSIPGSGRSFGEGNGNPLQIVAWRIPWTEEPGGPQSMGSWRVGHNWATNTTATPPSQVWPDPSQMPAVRPISQMPVAWPSPSVQEWAVSLFHLSAVTCHLYPYWTSLMGTVCKTAALLWL